MAQNGKQKVQRVQFVETVLRDANQSLIATRLPYSKFEAILPTMDKAGYYACECWGGATFDVCLRYLHEDPWERLRKIRPKCPIPSCKCCSGARTSWATPTIPMTLSGCLSGSPWRTALTSSVFLTRSMT